MFKKRRGIHLSYDEQGLIHFVCVNIDKMPEEVQDKIHNLCYDIGGDAHFEVLFKVVTDSKKSIRALAREYFISETQLYYYRKKFYEAW